MLQPSPPTPCPLTGGAPFGCADCCVHPGPAHLARPWWRYRSQNPHMCSDHPAIDAGAPFGATARAFPAAALTPSQTLRCGRLTTAFPTALPESGTRSRPIDLAGHGNFDIVLDHLSLSFSALHDPADAARYTLLSAHAYRMLISTCNPMFCPIHGIRSGSGSRPGVDTATPAASG